MPEPLFEFFEVIAAELSAVPSKVITNDDVSDQDSPLLEKLMKSLKSSNLDSVIPTAVHRLRDHFLSKGAHPPFSYDAATGMFTVVDQEFCLFAILSGYEIGGLDVQFAGVPVGDGS